MVERSYDAIPAGGEEHQQYDLIVYFPDYYQQYEDFDTRRPNVVDQLGQDYLNPIEGNRGNQKGGIDSKHYGRDSYMEVPAELKEGGVAMERSYGHTHVYHDHVHNHTNEHDHEHKVKFHQNQT